MGMLAETEERSWGEREIGVVEYLYDVDIYIEYLYTIHIYKLRRYIKYILYVLVQCRCVQKILYIGLCTQ